MVYQWWFKTSVRIWDTSSVLQLWNRK